MLPRIELFKYLPAERIDFFENPCVRFTPYLELEDPREGLTAFTSYCTPVEFFRDYHAIVDTCIKLFSLRHADAWKLRDMPRTKVFEFLHAEECHLAEVTRDLHVRYGYGVLSLSMNPYHECLWARYAGRHKGFAIGLRPGASMLEPGTWEARRALFQKQNVEYVAQREELSFWSAARDVQTYFKCLFRKSVVWSHEEEVRAVVSDAYDLGTRGCPGLVPLEVGDIKEIILGANVDPEVAAQAGKFCKKYGISLKRARLYPDRWLLGHEQML